MSSHQYVCPSDMNQRTNGDHTNDMALVNRLDNIVSQDIVILALRDIVYTIKHYITSARVRTKEALQKLFDILCKRRFKIEAPRATLQDNSVNYRGNTLKIDSSTMNQDGDDRAYKAKHEQEDKYYQINMVRVDNEADRDKKRARFERIKQLRLSGRFVCIHEVLDLDVTGIEGGDYLVIVKDCLDSSYQPLSVLMNGVVWKLEAVKALGRELAQTFEFLHGKGFTHRDVRPETLFVKIDCQSGFHCLIESVECDIGNDKKYMPPEVYGNRLDYRPASDIFALGCVLLSLVYPEFHAQQYIKNQRMVRLRIEQCMKGFGALCNTLLKMVDEEPERRPNAKRVKGECTATEIRCEENTLGNSVLFNKMREKLKSMEEASEHKGQL